MSTDYALREDLARILRKVDERLKSLERQTQRDVSIGTIEIFTGSLRPNRFARTRDESVGSQFTARYPMNEIGTATVAEQSDPLLNGTLAASVESSLPRLGQPGGLASEGSYSVSFAGTNHSRINLPLILAQQRGWTAEVIFMAPTLPQNSCLFWNGAPDANGFGLMIGNGSGGSGSGLHYRANGATNQWISLGTTLVAGQWYHATLISEAAGGSNLLHYFVGTLDGKKKFTLTSGSAAQSAPVMPTEATFIGCNGGPGGGRGDKPFNGYIDEVLFHDEAIAGSTSSIQSAASRINTSLNPLPPNGRLLCDGEAVSRSQYAQLFAKIGTSEGVGDGSTTFNLPNIEGASSYTIKA